MESLLVPSSREPFETRCRRAAELLDDVEVDALMVSDPATVRWLTGRVTEGNYAPLYPFSAGTHVVLDRAGRGLIITPEGDVDGPAIEGLSVVGYEAYTLGALEPFRRAAALVGRHSRLAVEAHAVPVALMAQRDWVDVTDRLRALRLVKDATEIERLRHAAAIVSAGQRALRDVARPGRREIEVYADVHAAMEAAAGDRVPVFPDLLSGPRLMEVGKPPTTRVIQPDELVLCDLLGRVDGYWADSCTTICVGTPTADMRRLETACHEALDAGIAAARPGISAGDLDSLVRGVMSRHGYSFPHHVGHGVGVTYHEEPRIVPGSTLCLEAGMVIALEPAGFRDGIGMRIEHLVLVGGSGAEVLTTYPTTL